MGGSLVVGPVLGAAPERTFCGVGGWPVPQTGALFRG
jgi:hypothetical protein